MDFLSNPDILALITSLADSLAWPIATIGATFILRPILKELSTLVKTIKYKDLEISLEESVEKVAKEAESIKNGWDAVTPQPTPESIDPDPRIAVIKAWASVETLIEKLVQVNKNRLGQGTQRSTRQRIGSLLKAGVIDHPLASILREMNSTRNMIAHGEDIFLNENTVWTFVEAVTVLETFLEQHLSTQQANST